MTNRAFSRATSLARPADFTERSTSSKSLYAAGASSIGYLRQFVRMSASSNDRSTSLDRAGAWPPCDQVAGRAVVDAVAAQLSTRVGHHHRRTGLRIAGQQNRVARLGERRSFSAWCPPGNARVAPLRCTQAGVVIDNFLARNVVADEIHQLPRRSRDDLLERFEHQRVDQQVIDRREVRAERHVVQVRVRFGGAERRVDQLPVVAGQRDVSTGRTWLAAP